MHLAPLTAAFLAGIFLRLLRLYSLPVCAGVLVLAIIITLKRKGKIAAFVCISLFLIGYIRANTALLERERTSYEFDSVKLRTEFIVTDFSKDGLFNAKTKLGGKTYFVSVNLKDSSDLRPGDIIEAESLFSAPLFLRDSYSLNYGDYLSGRNIFLTAKVLNYTLKGRDKSLFFGNVYKVRRYIASVSEKFFDSDERAMFCAMILGDKSLISDELSKSLRTSGISHIAVVSGMHLSVLMSVVMFLINRLLGKGRKSVLLSMFFLIFITFVMGCGASVVRAALMYTVYSAADILYREKDQLSSLCVTVLLMLLYNPFLVFNVGFVFSVLSVLGIIMFNPKISDKLNKIMPKKAASVLAVTLSVQIIVMPVSIYLFGEISLYALLTNLLVYMLSSVTIISGILTVIFAKIPVLSAGTAAVCKASARGIISAAYAVSRFPFSSIRTAHLGLFALVICLFAIFIIYFHPTHTIKIIFGVFLISIISNTCMGAIKAGEIAVTFLPYESGDCSLLSLPENKLIMVDCKSESDAEDILDSRRIPYYDCAILCGENYLNVLSLAQKGMVKRLILPENIKSSKLNSKLNELKFTDIIFLSENEPVSVCGAKAEFLKYGVLKITYGKRSFLTMQGLRQSEAESIYNEGCIFKADAVKLPGLHLDILKLLKCTYTGETVLTKKIILKV